MIAPINILATLAFISSLANAVPLHLHEKREIVTRVHTASTTETVTDVYSTTTQVAIAPTVEFIISGTVTYTTTLIPEGVDPTAQPSTAFTTILQGKQANNVPSGSATSTQSPVTTTTSDPTSATSSLEDQQTTTTTSTPQGQQSTTTASPVTSSQVQETTTTSSASLVSAIDNTEVSASVVTPPPAEVHSSATTAAVTTSTTDNQATTTTTPTTSSTSTAETSTSVSSSSVPTALTYSPYNSDGTCRSAALILTDLQLIQSKGVNKVRIYGTDCDSLETVQPACVQLGMKINQGLWIDSTGVDSIDDGVTALIAYGEENGWDVFDFITIGNEAINSGYCSVSDLISKIASVKSQLQSAGYTGQVTTSEPPVSYEDNPQLCTESAIDFVGINAHSYFNADVDAAGAGAFVLGQKELTQSVCGTSNVVITETGYPSSGDQNGLNIPSVANQQIAIQTILEETNQEVTILSYFDDLWKSPGPYDIENSFGIESFMP